MDYSACLMIGLEIATIRPIFPYRTELHHPKANRSGSGSNRSGSALQRSVPPTKKKKKKGNGGTSCMGCRRCRRAWKEDNDERDRIPLIFITDQQKYAEELDRKAAALSRSIQDIRLRLPPPDISQRLPHLLAHSLAANSALSVQLNSYSATREQDSGLGFGSVH